MRASGGGARERGPSVHREDTARPNRTREVTAGSPRFGLTPRLAASAKIELGGLGKVGPEASVEGPTVEVGSGTGSDPLHGWPPAPPPAPAAAPAARPQASLETMPRQCRPGDPCFLTPSPKEDIISLPPTPFAGASVFPLSESRGLLSATPGLRRHPCQVPPRIGAVRRTA